MKLQSSNPTMEAARRWEAGWEGDAGNTATVYGVADRTAILVALCTIAGVGAYAFLPFTGGVMLASCLAAMVVGFGVAFVLYGNPAKAKVLAPVYAIVEGVFLGMLTKALDVMLVGAGVSTAAVGGSLALPAFVITVSCLLAMLILYRAKIIRPTEKFKAVVGTLTLGVMFAYLAMFVLSFFGISIPFLSITSAFDSQQAMIGLGLNVFILGLASLWLVIDFGEIEKIVESGKPKDMEWFGAFMLLVTLAWIYYEAVKLAFRIAVLLNNRD